MRNPRNKNERFGKSRPYENNCINNMKSVMAISEVPIEHASMNTWLIKYTV